MDVDHETLKQITVELQKAAQGRTDLSNALAELELYANQQAHGKKKALVLYSELVAEYLRRGDISSPSFGSAVPLGSPSSDLDLRCFPVVRRPNIDVKPKPGAPKATLQSLQLFDA